MSLVLEYIMCYFSAFALGFFTAIGMMLVVREYNARHSNRKLRYFRKHHVRR